MKSRIFLVAILMMLLVSCASATVVNTSEFGVSSGGIYNTIIINGVGSDIYSPALDHTINQYVFRLYGDDTIASTTLSFKNGDTETIGIKTVSTSWFPPTAEYQITGCNGNVKTIVYYMAIPWSKSNPPSLRTRYVYSNITDQFYLYTGTVPDKGDPLDTDNDSFCVVDAPDLNPILQVEQIVDGDGLEVTYQSVLTDEIGDDVIDTKEGVACAAGDVGCWLGKVWGFFASIIATAATIAAIALNLLPTILNITNFILAGQVFLGFNVLYFAFAVLLSIEDSDDIFNAFGKVFRRMMKLWRFYMEVFRWIKDLIKWW